MVIKRHCKEGKSLQNAAGFLLLEAVSLIGFVVVSVSLLSCLQGRIMSSCQETTNRLRALRYAENILASTLTGVPYTLPSDHFRAYVQRQQAASCQAGVPEPLLVTVTVTWHESSGNYGSRGDKKITLTSCELGNAVPV